MLTFAQKYGRNVHSQNNEDGIIEECIKRIDPELRNAVEFGAPTWEYCSNTAYLSEQGWAVRMYDMEPSDQSVTKAYITPQNVNDIVGDTTVLSIDCDGPDYWIWKEYSYEPAIVIIEINSSIPPNIWEVPGDRGASYLSMVQLGFTKGYTLLCHTGNLIFILDKYKYLFPEIIGHPFHDPNLYFNKSFL